MSEDFIPLRRPLRKCNSNIQICKIHALALTARNPNKRNKLLRTLLNVMTPLQQVMMNIKDLSITDPYLFCSFFGRGTSDEVSQSMLGCCAYNPEIVDNWSSIQEITIDNLNEGIDDHCIFLSIKMGEQIMLSDPASLATNYVDERMREDKSTMQIFSPISFKATQSEQQRFALVCMDLIEKVIYIFDASYKIPAFYKNIVQAYTVFAQNEIAYAEEDSRQWRASYFNYVTAGVSAIDNAHTGPLVCVLMDIFSAGCEYSKVDNYVSDNNMMNIRAILYTFMQGFHYNPPGSNL